MKNKNDHSVLTIRNQTLKFVGLVDNNRIRYRLLIITINQCSKEKLKMQVTVSLDVVSSALIGVNTLYIAILVIFRHSVLEDSGFLTSFIDLLSSFSLLIAYKLSHVAFNDDTYLTISSIVTIFGAFLVSKQLHKSYVIGKKFRLVDLSGKVFIITGANSGIGFDTAKEIAAMNGIVVMACRSVEKANEARTQILNSTNCSPTRLIVLKLDLCSLTSVHSFVKDFTSLGLSLHALINNAGLMMENRTITEDGFETVFSANHLSHFLLTNLLLPHLEKTSGRIVVLSSSLHKLPSKFNFENVMGEKSFSLFGQYSQSKLANILFGLELQRRLTKGGSRVCCNVVHPGCVQTNVTQHLGLLMRLAEGFVYPMMLLLRKTPAQGAYCSIHVATAPSLEGVGGLYFENSEPQEPGRAARSTADAERLWTLSDNLVNARK